MAVKNRPKVLVLALDGMDPVLTERLMADGRLPALARLREQAWCSTFQATVPAVSPVIWTTMLTGRSPSFHGIVDLVVRKRRGYTLMPGSGRERLCPTLLPALSRAGKAVASIGLPGSYPPEKLHSPSLQVGGFDSPWGSAMEANAVSPPAARHLIDRMGGWRYGSFNEFIGPGTTLSGWDDIARAIKQDLATKTTIARHLLSREAWDLFIVHFQTIDTASHHLWHLEHCDSPLHPMGQPAIPYLSDIYCHMDSTVESILQAAGQGWQVMVLSDHGMGGSSGLTIHLNRLLEQAGLLRFTTWAQRGKPMLDLARAAVEAAPAGMHKLIKHMPIPAPFARLAGQAALRPALDWDHTLVWAQEIDASPAIHVNLRGRDPLGIVEKDELPDLIDALRSTLLKLCDPRSGKPVFSHIHQRNQIHSGPASWKAPDFILEYAFADDGYRASVVPAVGSGPPVELRTMPGGKGWGMPGVHRGGGVWWATGPTFEPQTSHPASYEDVAPTISACLGLPPELVPEGRIQPSNHDMGSVSQSPTTKNSSIENTVAAAEHTHDVYSAEDQTYIENQLRLLGYIE